MICNSFCFNFVFTPFFFAFYFLLSQRYFVYFISPQNKDFIYQLEILFSILNLKSSCFAFTMSLIISLVYFVVYLYFFLVFCLLCSCTLSWLFNSFTLILLFLFINMFKALSFPLTSTLNIFNRFQYIVFSLLLVFINSIISVYISLFTH